MIPTKFFEQWDQDPEENSFTAFCDKKHLEEAVDAKTISKAATDILSEISTGLSDEDKVQAITKLITYVSPENLEDLWETIKEFFEDRVLTEEDKDILVRKTGIDRRLLDSVDTAATATHAINMLAPTAIGIAIDVLQLTPIEDVVVGTVTSGWGLIITSILSHIPEGTIIGALFSIVNIIGHKAFVFLKDLFINKILPEPKEELTERATQQKSYEKYYTRSLAEEFEEYSSMWNVENSK